MPLPVSRRVKGRPVNKGFSLVELAVTLTVVAALSSLLVFWFASSRSPQLDAAAKASLVVFSRVEEDAFRRDGEPVDATEILNGAFDRGEVSFTAAASDGVSVVSVYVDGSVVSGAVLAGGDCWGLRLDMRPSASSPRSWWFVDVASSSCTGSAFTSPAFPADGTGTDPGTPTVL
jgi:prepilin-type N-terminal cleavage/methylation domain-containing protein